MRASWIRKLLPLLVLAVGCGGAVKPSTTTLRASAGDETAVGSGGPTIDWNHPLANGEDVDPSALNPSAVAASAGLTFVPVLPGVAQRMTSAEVTDPRLEPPQGRGTAFVYDFSGVSGAGPDPRLVVFESPARMSEADLEAIPANPAGPPSDFVLHKLSNGTVVLVIEHDGVGRAMFLRNGVQYDVTGPAVDGALVLSVAAGLSDALVAHS